MNAHFNETQRSEVISLLREVQFLFHPPFGKAVSPGKGTSVTTSAVWDGPQQLLPLSHHKPFDIRAKEEELRSLFTNLPASSGYPALDPDPYAMTLRKVMEDASVPLFLKDKDGCYLQANRHFAALFGLKNANITGLTDFDLYPMETALRIRSYDRKALEGGKTLEFSIDLPQTGSLGATFITMPVHSPLGGAWATVGAKITVAPHFSFPPAPEDEYGFIDKLPGFAFIADDRGTVLKVNTRLGSALEPDMLTGKNVTAFFPGGSGGQTSNSVLRAGPHKTVFGSGRQKLQVAWETRVWHRPGQADCHIAVGVEISSISPDEAELKKAKEKAEEASVLKDKFVTLVAHDLRAPFTTIIGLLKHLEHDKRNPLHETHRQAIDRAVKSSETLLQMIDELLNISRLKSGILKPHPSFFNANALVESATDNLRLIAEEKRIALVNDVSRDMRLFADRNLFKEVIGNLVSNSLKFTRPGGTIRVFTPEGRRSTLAVEDNGVGIPLEKLEKLFKHEEKISTTGTAGERGTGLGLPFCHDIMEAHGGTIVAESEPDKGTVFFVTPPFRKPKILFVDDNRDIYSLVDSMLEDLEAEIIFAVDGEDGLLSAHKHRPDVIITDISMPVMDGFALLAKLRSSQELKKIPVIMVTSDSDIGLRDRAFQGGGRDFISKPLLKEDFLPRVKRFLEGGT